MIEIRIPVRPFEIPVTVYQLPLPGADTNGVRVCPMHDLAELEPSTLAALCDEFRDGVFATADKADPKPRDNELHYAVFCQRSDDQAPKFGKAMRDRVFADSGDAEVFATECAATEGCVFEVREIIVSVGAVVTTCGERSDVVNGECNKATEVAK